MNCRRHLALGFVLQLDTNFGHWGLHFYNDTKLSFLTLFLTRKLRRLYNSQ